MPRAACAELLIVALSVLSIVLYDCWRCHILIGSAGLICRGEKNIGTERRPPTLKTKLKKYEYKNMYIPIPGVLGTSYHIRGKTTVYSKESLTQGTVPHGTARRCAAVSYI